MELIKNFFEKGLFFTKGFLGFKTILILGVLLLLPIIKGIRGHSFQGGII